MKQREDFLKDDLGPLLEHPKNNNKTEPNIPFKLGEFDKSFNWPSLLC